MADDWFQAPPTPPLTGEEHFRGIDAIAADFWRFALSDLRMNNARGYLAEYLVAKAVGATGPRVEWDAFDVLAPDGIKIEVKSSAYLQAWDQRHLSRIVFTGLKGRLWSPEEGAAMDATYNADVYVFCVQTAQEHAAYAPLDVGQWEFYVLPRETVETLGQQSLGLATLHRLTDGSVAFDGLASSIQRAVAGEA